MRAGLLIAIAAQIGLVSTESIASNTNLPIGLTNWVYQECLAGKDQNGEGCNPVTSVMTMYRNGNMVCGTVTLITVFKEGGGSFAGRIRNNVITVAFTNSWIEPSRQGRAKLTINNNKLIWKTSFRPKEFYYDPPDVLYFLATDLIDGKEATTASAVYVPQELVECTQSAKAAAKFLGPQ